MMLVLHGSWVLAQGTVPARFVLWGETTEPPRTTSARGLRGARPSIPIAAHPFAPKTHRLLDVLICLRLREEADVQLVRSLVIHLPSARGAPLPSLAARYALGVSTAWCLRRRWPQGSWRR
jgi:hypothetical protein